MSAPQLAGIVCGPFAGGTLAALALLRGGHRAPPQVTVPHTDRYRRRRSTAPAGRGHG